MNNRTVSDDTTRLPPAPGWPPPPGWPDTDLTGFYRTLLERTFDLILVVNEERRITFCNHASATLLGYLPEGLAGQSLLDLAHPDDKDRLQRILDRPASAAPAFPIRIFHANGSWRLVESQISRTIDAAGSRLTVVVSRDITTDPLGTDQAGDARTAALERTTTEVAHDINNLLHAMTLQLELIEGRAKAEWGAATEPLSRALKTASDLTGQLLALARDGAEPRASRMHTDAHALINRSRMLLRTLARRTTKLSFELEATITDVELPSHELMQILVNLVANARDAMPGGGRLTITTRNLPDGGRQCPGGALALEIADTGIGMPVNVRARIFDPFFTTKPAGRGSGLGLPAVLAIVRRSGGCIEVSSADGQGTTVRILLPLAPGTPATDATSAA